MITVAAIRMAIANCVAQASADAPSDAELRVTAFVARLSGSMESLGDHELDAMIWGLFDMPPQPRLCVAPVLNPIPMPAPARFWG
jgi:hypothetical protein